MKYEKTLSALRVKILRSIHEGNEQLTLQLIAAKLFLKNAQKKLIELSN